MPKRPQLHSFTNEDSAESDRVHNFELATLTVKKVTNAKHLLIAKKQK